MVRRKIELILGLGVIARVAQYLANRHYWLDEGSLQVNIVTKTLREMFGPLANSQLAPPGFLAVERGAYHLLGNHALALRLFPLVGGVASQVRN